ncbi:MAG: type I 3-dehydroquinate dehydratase [Lachnospiraceae bacterium]|nr:type I 3-dehydroquinate dehydratase [Lachnospiraceae bacterium]
MKISSGIKLKNDFIFCYPILEDSRSALIKKISQVDKERKCMIELRLDYLLCAGMSIEDIIGTINYIKSKVTNKKIIATIRTVSEGGRVDLTKEKYFTYIKELYLKSRVHFIDVEYKFYKIDKIYYDSLFKKKKKKIIISMHIFDRIFFENEYIKLFTEMAESSGNIVKFAIKTFTKEDLFTFMIAARKCEKMIKKNKKDAIFIAMGTVGVLSRLWPEFTSTKIVFLTAYKEIDIEFGQMNREKYVKYRKLLAKIGKN